MSYRTLLIATCFGGLMLFGCEKKSETPAGSPAPTPQASEKAADATKSKAEDAKDATKDMAKDTSKEMKKDAETAAAQMKQGADAAANAVASQPAAGDATAKIQQVMDYIKDHKLDLAETTLKEVEANKASLPPAVAAQVDNARKMLDTAKAAAGGTGAAPGGTNLPAPPAVPAPK
jgi:hypothetical protein